MMLHFPIHGDVQYGGLHGLTAPAQGLYTVVLIPNQEDLQIITHAY